MADYTISGVVQAMKFLKSSEEVQATVERAVGKALIEKLAGKKATLIETYRELGGADPVAVQVLKAMDEPFAKLGGVLTNPRQIAKRVANTPRVTASKEVSMKVQALYEIPSTAHATFGMLKAIK